MNNAILSAALVMLSPSIYDYTKNVSNDLYNTKAEMSRCFSDISESKGDNFPKFSRNICDVDPFYEVCPCARLKKQLESDIIIPI